MDYKFRVEFLEEASRMKTYSLEEMTDKHIGKKGTVKRDAFEEELRLDILGQTIKNIRKERHLTQSELGELVGVQKSQISKVENNLTDARFDTILKVFNALGVTVKFNVEMA
jgi:DNA-binding XRE family transcriptional regulator